MTLVKVTPRFGGEATDGLGLVSVDVYDKGVHDFRLVKCEPTLLLYNNNINCSRVDFSGPTLQGVELI